MVSYVISSFLHRLYNDIVVISSSSDTDESAGNADAEADELKAVYASIESIHNEYDSQSYKNRLYLSLYCRDDKKTFLSLLKEHITCHLPALNVLASYGPFDRIDVRRNRILASAMRSFSRNRISGRKVLKVRFFGEEAVDDGGPRQSVYRTAN